MSRNLIAALALVGATVFAAPAMAEELSEHTFMLTYADEHCDGFTYSEDMLRHANIAVLGAPEEEVAKLRADLDRALTDIYNGNRAEQCEMITFLIENLEEDEE